MRLLIRNGILTYDKTVKHPEKGWESKEVGKVDATAFTWHRKSVSYDVEGTTTTGYACLELGILIIEYPEDTRRSYFSYTNDEELESWEKLPGPPEIDWCKLLSW